MSGPGHGPLGLVRVRTWVCQVQDRPLDSLPLPHVHFHFSSWMFFITYNMFTLMTPHGVAAALLHFHKYSSFPNSWYPGWYHMYCTIYICHVPSRFRHVPTHSSTFHQVTWFYHSRMNQEFFNKSTTHSTVALTISYLITDHKINTAASDLTLLM